MKLSNLRRTRTEFRPLGQVITFKHEHLIEMIDQGACCPQPGDAGAHDDCFAVFLLRLGWDGGTFTFHSSVSLSSNRSNRIPPMADLQ
jgi:hypothetical protein